MCKNSTYLAISAMMWFEKVRGALELVLREGSVPRTHVKELYTPCYLCNDVVREGSRRFNALELVLREGSVPRTHVKELPCSLCSGVLEETDPEVNCKFKEVQ